MLTMWLPILKILLLLEIKPTNGDQKEGHEQSLHHREKRDLLDFADMVHTMTGRSAAFEYNGYGCWCGKGGHGATMDGTDNCCYEHDTCYDVAINTNTCSKLQPYVVQYDYESEPPITCSDDWGTCARAICECDRIAAECFASQTYHSKYFNMNDDLKWTHCRVPECGDMKKFIINRQNWNAENLISPAANLSQTPVNIVFIHHTSRRSCSTYPECRIAVKDVERLHLYTYGYDDIAYNYLVGEDGLAYEGRGWDKEGAHTYGYNKIAVSIAVLGDFDRRKPSSRAMNAIRRLLSCAVEHGYLSSDYELFGHRDGSNTGGPGDKLYEEIITWNKYSTRELVKYNEEKTIIAEKSCKDVEIVGRNRWKARNAISPADDLPASNIPVKMLVIHHTGSLWFTFPRCSSLEECADEVRDAESKHLDDRGYSDIGYNYLVGEDGRAYEGRGWSKEGAHTKGYNNRSVAISVIGNFNYFTPNEKAFDAVRALIACAIEGGYLSQDYELFGHRNSKDTDCPGHKLYAKIQGWPSFSTRLLQNVEKKQLTPVERCKFYGDITKLKTKGANLKTSTLEGKSKIGIAASHDLLDEDISHLNANKDCFKEIGIAYGIHPALIGAIASKVSRGGQALTAEGYGVKDSNLYGIMQCSVVDFGEKCTQHDAHSCEHIKMAVDDQLVPDIRLYGFKDGIAAYRENDANFFDDVIARSHRLIIKHQWSCDDTTHTGSPPSSGSSNCIDMQKNGDCDFYKECIEKEVPCGDAGYAIGYGYRYCNRFSLFYNEFTEQGKKWIDAVKVCIMKTILPHSRKPNIKCPELRKIGFDSQLKCFNIYEQNGPSLCSIMSSNMIPMAKVFEGKDNSITTRLQDVSLVWNQILASMKSCGNSVYNSIKEGLKKIGKVIASHPHVLHPGPIGKRSAEAECEQYARDGDCRFYECFEERFPCKDNEYYSHIKDFELVRCMKFKQLSLNNKVEQWIINTQKCIMSTLLTLYHEEDLNCAIVFATIDQVHLSCLIDAGYCSLDTTDEWMIERATDVKGFPYISPVGFVTLPLSQDTTMIEEYYYEAVHWFKIKIGYANEECFNQGYRTTKEFYKFAQTRHGLLKQRTEL